MMPSRVKQLIKSKYLSRHRGGKKAHWIYVYHTAIKQALAEHARNWLADNVPIIETSELADDEAVASMNNLKRLHRGRREV